MEKHLFTLLAPALLFTSLATAEIVSQTFTGLTTRNQVEDGAITTAFPVGTRWTVMAEWDSAAPSTFLSDSQGSYPLTKFTVTLEGQNGVWTTSSLPNKASFSLGKYGGINEIQFTSGWGPENHTNAVIEDGQPYSVNLTLTDPTGTAISSLGTSPTTIDPAAWQDSEFKIYLNNDGTRAIYGSSNPDSIDPSIYQTGSGNDANDISVRLPGARVLEDGSTIANFGRTKVGKSGKVTKFTITNTSDTVLKKIKVALSGAARRDYIIVSPAKSSVAPGKSTTFIVRFAPGKKGPRKALIRIAGSTTENKTFTIPVAGTGL
ncbi:MAG: hypothetical protein RLZZ214_1796 [Verrucomicrobiota bacterium]|jgi:hypothetical protein